MKYMGCAYYPEYWGKERLKIDAGLMRDAGINIVRVGEFAWSRMEPEEGVFTLDWLHECIQIMGEHGIKVLLCTPTATPPAWLTSTYPDTLSTNAFGNKIEHGARRQYCYSSDTYRRHAVRIAEKLSREFSGYPNVVAWQIDNEPDFIEVDICHCQSCQGKFQAWLKERYGTVQQVNESWGTGFWSHDYTDWHQMTFSRATKNQDPSRKLDTLRFASHMLSDFVLMQADIVRRNHPGAVVSTNLDTAIFSDLDYNRLFSALDVAYKDLYFDMGTMDQNVLVMNQFRSFKPGTPYWITETGSGAIDGAIPPHKDQFKAWVWSSFAHGGEAYIIFRWRTALSGQEQELRGIIEHSGHPGRRYQAVKEAFHEMKEWAERLGDLPLPTAEIAIVHDYDVKWGYQSSFSDFFGAEIDYEHNFCHWHRHLYHRNLPVDVITPDRDLQEYKLVILPSLTMIDEVFADQLKNFVRGGGIVIAQGQLGMKDRNNNYWPEMGPRHLTDMFGVKIVDGMYLYSQVAADEGWGTRRRNLSIGVVGQLGTAVSGQAEVWLADLEADGANVLIRVSEDIYEGQPAVTEHPYGTGTAIYAAAMRYDDGLTDSLFEYALNKAGIAKLPQTPEHVEIIRRGDIIFLINHRNEAVSIDWHEPYTLLKGGAKGASIRLAPFDVAILKHA